MANIKLIKYIEKAKRDLRQQLKINGYSENLGQKELRQAQNLIDYNNYNSDCQIIEAFNNFIDNL